MNFFLTKEIGTAWSEINGGFDGRWGASEGQYSIARKIQKGDRLLHYVNSVRSWVGYSVATGPIQANTIDQSEDWRVALPYVIPISRGAWLTESQAQLTTQIDSLTHQNFHRPRTFSQILESDGEKIVRAIDCATLESPKLQAEFHTKWQYHAEAYYKGIVIALAKGNCQLCKANARVWANSMNVPLSEAELEKLQYSFLDAAHIMPNSTGGSMLADNLRALCPTCHRVLDRLDEDRRMEIFKIIKLQTKS